MHLFLVLKIYFVTNFFYFENIIVPPTTKQREQLFVGWKFPIPKLCWKFKSISARAFVNRVLT